MYFRRIQNCHSSFHLLASSGFQLRSGERGGRGCTDPALPACIVKNFRQWKHDSDKDERQKGLGKGGGAGERQEKKREVVQRSIRAHRVAVASSLTSCGTVAAVVAAAAAAAAAASAALPAAPASPLAAPPAAPPVQLPLAAAWSPEPQPWDRACRPAVADE